MKKRLFGIFLRFLAFGPLIKLLSHFVCISPSTKLSALPSLVPETVTFLFKAKFSTFTVGRKINEEAVVWNIPEVFEIVVDKGINIEDLKTMLPKVIK